MAGEGPATHLGSAGGSVIPDAADTPEPRGRGGRRRASGEREAGSASTAAKRAIASAATATANVAARYPALLDAATFTGVPGAAAPAQEAACNGAANTSASAATQPSGSAAAAAAGAHANTSASTASRGPAGAELRATDRESASGALEHPPPSSAPHSFCTAPPWAGLLILVRVAERRRGAEGEAVDSADGAGREEGGGIAELDTRLAYEVARMCGQALAAHFGGNRSQAASVHASELVEWAQHLLDDARGNAIALATIRASGCVARNDTDGLLHLLEKLARAGAVRPARP